MPKGVPKKRKHSDGTTIHMQAHVPRDVYAEFRLALAWSGEKKDDVLATIMQWYVQSVGEKMLTARAENFCKKTGTV